MNKIAGLLIILSIGLLIYLRIKYVGRVDFAVSKNNHLMAQNKAKIDSMANIDSIKVYAKELIDINRENFLKESGRAVPITRILFLIIILQLAAVVMIFKKRKI